MCFKKWGIRRINVVMTAVTSVRTKSSGMASELSIFVLNKVFVKGIRFRRIYLCFVLINCLIKLLKFVKRGSGNLSGW
jgi:hypothetical protein